MSSEPGKMTSTLPPLLPPLPASGFAPVSGRVFLLFPFGYGLTSLADRNGVARSDPIQRGFTRAFDLMLQLVLETFQRMPDEGGVCFINQLSAAEREARTQSPFESLVGPYLTHCYVAFSNDQAQEFMKLFSDIMNPVEDEVPKSKRSKKQQQTRPHPNSRHFVKRFNQWQSAVAPWTRMVFQEDSFMFDVRREHSTAVPAAAAVDTDGDDASDGVMDANGIMNPNHGLYRHRGAHPLTLFDIKTMLPALRCDISVDDVIRQHDGSKVMWPSTELQDAAVCIPLSPTGLVNMFTDQATLEVDASTLFKYTPFYLTPTDSQIDKAVESYFCGIGFPEMPQHIDCGFAEDDSERWKRRLIVGQQFSPEERGAREAQKFQSKLPYIIDPTRDNPSTFKDDMVSAALGETVQRMLYSRLMATADANGQALDEAIRLSPVDAYRVLASTVEQAYIVCNGQGTAGLPPNLLELMRTVQHKLSTMAAIPDLEERARLARILLAANVDHSEPGAGDNDLKLVQTVEMQIGRETRRFKMTVSSAFDVWNIEQMIRHARLVATQIPVVNVSYMAAHRVLTDERKALNIAFLGDAGIGKSYAQSECFAKFVYGFFISAAGSNSEQGKIYSTENSDGVLLLQDENSFFEEKKQHCLGDQVSVYKTELEERAAKRQTTGKKLNEHNIEELQSYIVAKLYRGCNFCNVNYHSGWKEISDRWVYLDIRNPSGGGGTSSSGMSDLQHEVASFCALRHAISQLAYIPRHFINSKLIRSNTSMVDLFLGLLRKHESKGVGRKIPVNRGAQAVVRLAEARMMQELQHVFLTQSMGDRWHIRCSADNIKEFMLRAQPLAVVSPEAVVAAYTTLYPAEDVEIDRLISDILFCGMVLELKSDRADEYTWPWHKTVTRTQDNTAFATTFESLNALAGHIHDKLSTNTVCPGKETVLKKLLDMKEIRGGQQMSAISVTSMSYETAAGRTYSASRVCISNAALQAWTAPLEAAIMSGLLDIVAATPIEKLKFDDDGRVLLDIRHPSSLGVGLLYGTEYVDSALPVFDPYYAMGTLPPNQALAGQVANLANGVLGGRIRSPDRRVRALRNLVKTGKNEVGEPVSVDAPPESPGHSAAQLSIEATATVMQAKKMYWVQTKPAIEISEARDPTNYWSVTGDENGNPLFGGEARFSVAGTVGSHIKIDLDATIKAIDKRLNRSSLPEGLSAAIQDLYRIGYSKEWLEKAEPTIICGVKSVVIDRQIQAEIIKVPYEPSNAAVTVKDINHVPESAMTYTNPRTKTAVERIGRMNEIFPGVEPYRTFEPGAGLWARCVVSRFTRLFGPGWIGVPEIEKLISRQMWEHGIRAVMDETKQRIAEVLDAEDAAMA